MRSIQSHQWRQAHCMVIICSWGQTTFTFMISYYNYNARNGPRNRNCFVNRRCDRTITAKLCHTMFYILISTTFCFTFVSSWSCQAEAELRIINNKCEEPCAKSEFFFSILFSSFSRVLSSLFSCHLNVLVFSTRSCDIQSDWAYFTPRLLITHKLDIISGIKHLFCKEENDWGFGTFIPWNVSCLFLWGK